MCYLIAFNKKKKNEDYSLNYKSTLRSNLVRIFFFSDREILFSSLRGSWQDSRGFRILFVPRLAKKLEIQRSVPFYPFPFQVFKPRYYSLAVYVSRTVTEKRYFPRVYLGSRSIFIISTNGRSSRIEEEKKKFFLPLPCVRYICRFLSFFFFSFISFFETRVFLWNLFVRLKKNVFLR